MTLDELTEVAGRVGARLEAAHLHACLIGGLAVHRVVEVRRIGIEAELGHGLDLLPDTDPRHLAVLPRVTADLDVVVPSDELAGSEAVLTDLGLAPAAHVEPPPIRYVDHGTVVDLVPLDPGKRAFAGDAARDLEVALAVLEDQFEDEPDPRVHLRLARPAGLVVLKAAAYQSRWEERDLSDIARLALLDYSYGTTRAELVALFPSLPTGLQSVVHAMRDCFRDRDARGPSAFVAAIREPLPALAYEEGLEDDVRDRVVAAVSALLGGLEG